MSEDHETYDTYAPTVSLANGAQGPHANEASPARTVADLSDPEAFVTELSAATPFFEAQGAVAVRIGARQVRLKIRSVPKDVLDKAMHLLQGGRLPQVWDKKKNEWVANVEHPRFVEYALSLGYIKVVLGLAETVLRNRQGQIVWQSAGEVQDMAQAIQALRDMGITTPQVDTIVRAIDELTQAEAEQEVTDFLDRSADA